MASILLWTKPTLLDLSTKADTIIIERASIDNMTNGMVNLRKMFISHSLGNSVDC